MARIEADREDLLREAVALVRRVEFQPLPDQAPIVAGFRATGWLSIYFSPDQMYQFDEQGRLRRSYVDGLLYRTEGHFLAELRRERTAAETTLMRRDLTDDDLLRFRSTVLDKIRWLQGELAGRSLTVSRKVPGDDDTLLSDLQEFLTTILTSDQFLAPAIRR